MARIVLRRPLSRVARSLLLLRKLRQITTHDLKTAWEDLRGYLWYLRDLEAYLRETDAGPIDLRDLVPRTKERTSRTSFDYHYVYQDLWAFKRILESKVERHADVGSRIDLIAFLTAITRVTFIDLRPLRRGFPNFEAVKGSLIGLPFADRSVRSLSCLHVAEHVGLGRYGDPIDPRGTQRAMGELRRVLAPGGNLYFSLPVGRPRVCFNAHRVHSPAQILAGFSGLELKEFSGVNDQGQFRENRALSELEGCAWGCGMFWFTRAP